MSESSHSQEEFAGASREELLSALFASMVVQQTNMALMLLGKVPHPESGTTVVDTDGARMLIDQLEMLEVKTRGNLDEHEAKLLKQSLTALRMAFVEVVDRQASGGAATAPSSSSGAAQSVDSSAAAAARAEASSEPEARKKFAKKY